MGWLSKLFKVKSIEERGGIFLGSVEPYWEVKGPKTFSELFDALRGWVPEDAFLYFEDGSPDDEIENFMVRCSVPEVSHVAVNTISSHLKFFHVPATETLLNELSRIMKHHAEPELAIHFQIYRDNAIILSWPDAFFQPIFMNGSIPEERIQEFSDMVGNKYKRIEVN